MNETIKTALLFYIQHIKSDIAFMKDHGMDVGFLPKHLAEAEYALSKLQI